MSPAFWILIWGAAFAATHMILSSARVRPQLRARLGETGFLGLYSLLALGTFVPLCRAYFSARHQGPLLWYLRGVPGVHVAMVLLAALGFALLVASFVQPSPLGMGPEAGPPKARGLLRITRHTMFMPLVLWAAAHLVVNGWLTDVLFFGTLVVVGVAGCMHQDARKRETEGERLAPFFAETSLVPFAAIATGRNRLVLEELPWRAIAAGFVVGTVIYKLHPYMFR